MKWIQRFKDWCYKVYFRLIRKKCLITPADYLYLRQGEMTFSQLIIGTRIMDIERWQKDHRPIFHYTNALTMIKNKTFDTLEADKRFASLLESVERNGYDPESRIAINKFFTVNDGTHRAALAFCFGMETIPANFYNYPPHWHIEQLREAERDEEFHQDFEQISRRYNEIQEELKSKGYACSCLVLNVTNNCQEKLMLELTRSANVYKIYRIDTSKYNQLPSDKRKELTGIEATIENGYYISLLPILNDYQYKDERLIFKSISKLEDKLRKQHPHVIIADNYVDGVSCFKRLQEYLIE